MRVEDSSRIQGAQVRYRGIGIGVGLEVGNVPRGCAAKLAADSGCGMFYLAVYELGESGCVYFWGKMGRGFKGQGFGKFSGASGAAENTAAGA